MNLVHNKVLHRIGSSLSILGITFVAIKLFEYKDLIEFSNFRFLIWVLLLTLAVCYGLSGMLLALAWRDILRHFNVVIRRRWAIWAYGITQLARYVPGNIFHLVGRQTIGASNGLPAWPLAKASIWELGIIALTGGLYILLVLPIFLPSIPQSLATLAFFILLLFTIFFTLRWISASIALAIFLYAVFLGCSGLIFVTVLLLSHTNFSVNIPFLCGAYVIAWLAGLITPGAPAGAGVRELVLYSLLYTLITKEEIVVGVLLARVVTVFGDLLFYLIASFLFYQKGLDAFEE